MSNSNRFNPKDRRGQQIRIDAPIVHGRVPPHNLDAEGAVLSAILLNREALDRVLEILKPEHFYSDANGRIFEAAHTLSQANKEVDIITVAGVLRDAEKLAQIGGATYLAVLADATPSVANVMDHAKIVYGKWRLRKMIATCQMIAAQGYGEVPDVEEFIEAAEQAIYELARTTVTDNCIHIATATTESYQAAEYAHQSGQHIAGTPTGFERYDTKTSGLQDGDLTVVAARPGVGKSAWTLGTAVNVASPKRLTLRSPEGAAVEQDFPGDGVVFFSAEMPRKQISDRAMCAEGRVDIGKFKNGFLQPDDWNRLTEAKTYLDTLPIWFDDTSAPSLTYIRAIVRRKQAEYNRPASEKGPARRVGLVIVDSIQLCKGVSDRQGNREQEIAAIARELKQLAKDLKIPVMAISSISRKCEERQDKRPQLSDLRESGEIEASADVVVMIYRDEMVNENTDMKGIAELIIAKQRNGPTGKVMVRFQGSCTRFDNLSLGDYPEIDE